MRRLLDGKNIIITGTARGMGREMLRTFAEHGANVFAHARRETDDHKRYCVDLAQSCGVTITPVFFDLCDAVQMKQGAKMIRDSKMRIDGLVNNAGISHTALYQMTRPDKLREIFEVNFFAPYIFGQFIAKFMTQGGGGSIVNIASSAAIDGNPGLSAYAASKAALVAMTKSMAAELGTANIRVNAICPGVTATDMIEDMRADVFEIQQRASFLKKIAAPSDIANTAMMLLSDLSSYITGQVISVDGGVTEYDKR